MLKRIVILFFLLFSQSLLAMPVDLALTDMNGRHFKLSDYRGKWVVLNYWATWCPPCLEEIPELVLFHENHKDKDAVVIGIDMEMLRHEELARFVEDNFVTYPVVPMVADMPAFDNVESYPTTYLIDPEGDAVVKHVGAVTSDALEDFIDNYVPQHSASNE